MIKIIQDNATLPISENKKLIKYLNDGDISWDLNEQRMSFGALNSSLNRLFENQYIKDMTKAVLVVLPENAFSDMLIEMATLRTYDSSLNADMTFKTTGGSSCYITSSNKISNGFILCMSDLNIVPEKTIVEVNDVVVIESNKDLSKVDINVVGSVKLLNIRRD